MALHYRSFSTQKSGKSGYVKDRKKSFVDKLLGHNLLTEQIQGAVALDWVSRTLLKQILHNSDK